MVGPTLHSSLFSLDQLASIELAAKRMLAEIGVGVRNEQLLERLKALGYQVTADNRVLIDQAASTAFLEDVRRDSGCRFTVDPTPVGPTTSSITVDINRYAGYEHNISSDSLEALTLDRLIELAKLCDTLHTRGLRGGGVGFPQDIPALLRPIMQSWVCGTYTRNLDCSALIEGSPESMPFEMAMAEAMGTPIRTAYVFVLSPLELAGHSIDCAILGKDRFESVGVCSMPSAGATAPLLPADALAMSAAETFGSALLIREALGIRVWFSMSLYPVDMRSLFQVMGSPEELLLNLACEQVNAYMHGRTWSAAGSSKMITNAKLPGAQAAAEKSMVASTGVLSGSRHFTGIGTLGFDEIFSAEQLLYDLEIKDQAERLIQGLITDTNVDRAVEDVKAAFAMSGFAGLDTTAEHFRDMYWMPTLFQRDNIGRWRSRGERTEKEAVRAQVSALLDGYDFEPDPDKQRELDRVLEDAKRHLL